MPDAMKDFAKLLGGEVEEVGRRKEGDYDPTWDFKTTPLLAGRYLGTRSVKTADGESRTLHKFADASIGTEPGDLSAIGNIEAWGSTVLDQVMAEIDNNQKALVIFEGKKGRAYIFRAYRAKGVTA